MMKLSPVCCHKFDKNIINIEDHMKVIQVSHLIYYAYRNILFN
jgi:hypothetical protein